MPLPLPHFRRHRLFSLLIIVTTFCRFFAAASDAISSFRDIALRRHYAAMPHAAIILRQMLRLPYADIDAMLLLIIAFHDATPHTLFSLFIYHATLILLMPLLLVFSCHADAMLSYYAIYFCYSLRSARCCR